MEEVAKKLEFLQAEIEKRIKGFQSSRDFYRRRAFLVTIGTTILSAATTVLLGLKIAECNETIKVVAMIITALISIISAYNAFYAPKELWLVNNEAINKMYSLHHHIKYELSGKTSYDANLVNRFDQLYSDLLKEINEDWRNKRNK